MKKRDFFLILILILFFLTLFLFSGMNRVQGEAVYVYKDNELLGEYPLFENKTIPIGEGNLLEIKDGYADMVGADCRDEICVNHKPISAAGEEIICLPNKVIVKVGDGNEK